MNEDWLVASKEWIMPDHMQGEHILEQTFTVEGGDFIHAGEVSSGIKTILKEIGIDQHIIRKVAIAAYEAEMNVVCYADRGTFHLVITPDYLKIIVQEGFSTSSSVIKEMGFGAGMGLPNIKRNTVDLRITSERGKGTRLEMIIRTQT